MTEPIIEETPTKVTPNNHNVCGKPLLGADSVTTESGQRVQPDLVLHLPESKSIVLDSKVSLVAWTRYQSSEGEA